MAVTPMEETKKLNNSAPVGLQTSEIKHYTQKALQCLPCFLIFLNDSSTVSPVLLRVK